MLKHIPHDFKFNSTTWNLNQNEIIKHVNVGVKNYSTSKKDYYLES